jgi:hypothetical protein
MPRALEGSDAGSDLLLVRYRATSGGRKPAIHSYERNRNQVETICAFLRLKLSSEGVLLIGTSDCFLYQFWRGGVYRWARARRCPRRIGSHSGASRF